MILMVLAMGMKLPKRRCRQLLRSDCRLRWVSVEESMPREVGAVETEANGLAVSPDRYARPGEAQRKD